MLYLQPELLYSMKGAKNSFNFQGTSYTETYKYSYFEIPLLAKMVIPLENSNLKPMLFAGPSLAFKLSGKYHLKGDGQEFQVDDDR